jgi:hypothetical protein
MAKNSYLAKVLHTGEAHWSIVTKKLHSKTQAPQEDFSHPTFEAKDPKSVQKATISD